MKARISVLTIGVDDLERSLKFYRDGLGLSTEGIIGTEFEHGAVAFFDLQAGVKLAIWNRKDLSVEANVPLSPPSSSEFTIGHNVGSKEEVDEVMEQAQQGGCDGNRAGTRHILGGLLRPLSRSGRALMGDLLESCLAS